MTMAASAGSRTPRARPRARHRGPRTLRADDHAVPVEPNPPAPRMRSVELLRPRRLHLRDRDDHQLRDPVALRDLHRLVPIEVHDRAEHLAPVAGVDQARRVGEREALLGREPLSEGARGRHGPPGSRRPRPSAPSPVLPERRHGLGAARRSSPASPGCCAGGSSASGRRRWNGRSTAQTGSINSMRFPNGSRT